MKIRLFTDSDLPLLADLTVETFRPFYEDYVRSLLGEESFQHQHGNWKQDYRNPLPGDSSQFLKSTGGLADSLLGNYATNRSMVKSFFSLSLRYTVAIDGVTNCAISP